MSKACDSQESSGLSAALMPPAAALECERTGWTLLMIATVAPALGSRKGGPLTGQPGADDQDVMCGHGGEAYKRASDPRSLVCKLGARALGREQLGLQCADDLFARDDAAQTPVRIERDERSERAQRLRAEQRLERRPFGDVALRIGADQLARP